LFDTTVFIHHLLGKSPEATKLITQAISGAHPAAFSILTDAELWAGIRNEEEDHVHRLLLSRLTRLPINLSIARRAGKLVNLYKSHSLKLDDALIAATAEYYDIPLYTHNDKHFEFITTIKVIPYRLSSDKK
jgi:hypothetical protein